jgi:ADP-ribosylation factor-like protein 8
MVKKDNVKMKVWDLGGQERFRSEWPKYTKNSDVIVFVVDGHDVDKIQTAKKELHKLLEDKNLSGIPLLVCLNKIDLEPRFSKQEIVKSLNLEYITERPWVICPCSALKNTNINKVVDWLISHSK